MNLSYYRLITRTFVTLFPVVAVVCPGAAEGEESPSVNQKVLSFCKSQLGKKVGSGSCSALAREALTSAGAELRLPADPHFGRAWGKPLGSIEDAQPGDVLTFHDVHFMRVSSNGSERFVKNTFDFPDHVAIVKSVVKTRRKRTVLRILQQNVRKNGGKGKPSGVEEDVLYLDELQPGGWMRAYHPIERKLQASKNLRPDSKPSDKTDTSQPPEFQFEEEKEEAGMKIETDVSGPVSQKGADEPKARASQSPSRPDPKPQKESESNVPREEPNKNLRKSA